MYQNALGRSASAGGYRWVYIDDNDEEEEEEEEEDEEEEEEEEAEEDDDDDDGAEVNRGTKSVRQICKETGSKLETYSSLSAAARAVGLSSGSSICDCLNGRALSAGGYRWEYVEDEREDGDDDDDGARPSKAAKIDTHFSVPMHMIDASVAFVRAAPHPVLTGQFGLFATAAIARDERCFVEKLPRLSELPASLEDSDRYISWIHKADREEFIIADDDDGTSMTYFLNSSYARDGEVNPLDPRGRGANVKLSVDRAVGNGSYAFVTFRASRPIAKGEELLWTYEFEPRSSGPPRVVSRSYQRSRDALLAGSEGPPRPPPAPAAGQPFMSWAPAQFVGSQFDERFSGFGWFRGTVLSVSDGSVSIENYKGKEIAVPRGDLVVRYGDGSMDTRSAARLRILMKKSKPESSVYYPFITEEAELSS